MSYKYLKLIMQIDFKLKKEKKDRRKKALLL